MPIVDRQLPGDGQGDFLGDRLQHHRECPSPFPDCVHPQSVARRSLIRGLAAEPAQLVDRLGKQPQVTHDRNAYIDQAFCDLEHRSSTFELYSRRPAFLDQTPRVAHGFGTLT